MKVISIFHHWQMMLIINIKDDLSSFSQGFSSA